jgi:hypothetical protein
VADLGFGNGDPFVTTTPSPSVGVTYYAGVITGGGVNPIVITLGVANGPADGTPDNVVLQDGTGWVLGLIKTQYLSDLDNIDIEDIEYGIALPNKAMTDAATSPYTSGSADPPLPSKYYVKGSRDGPWIYGVPDGAIPEIGQPCVKMILGKQRTGVQAKDKYGVHIEEFSTDTLTFQQSLANLVDQFGLGEYEYGNYNLIIGMCKTGSSLTDIRWTSSKINNPVALSSGYYARAAPDLLLRDDGLVVPHTSGLTFFNTLTDTRFFMELTNPTTSAFFGFGPVETPQSDQIRTSSTLTVSIQSPKPMNFQYSFSENITVMINLPLDTYDGAEQRNAVAFI